MFPATLNLAVLLFRALYSTDPGKFFGFLLDFTPCRNGSRFSSQTGEQMGSSLVRRQLPLEVRLHQASSMSNA